jgi:hypothetical protein
MADQKKERPARKDRPLLRGGVADLARRIGSRPLMNQIVVCLPVPRARARTSRMTQEKQHRGPMVRYPRHAVGLAAETLYFN